MRAADSNVQNASSTEPYLEAVGRTGNIDLGIEMSDRMSALMDGELEDESAEALFATLRNDDELRHTWAAYHVIGDALRETPVLSKGFSARLAERLAEEPTVLAPPKPKPRKYPAIAWPAAASLAAVAILALALKPGHESGPGNLPVQPPASMAQASDNQATEHMRAYLTAHLEVSPGAAATGGDTAVARAAFDPQQDFAR